MLFLFTLSALLFVVLSNIACSSTTPAPPPVVTVTNNQTAVAPTQPPSLPTTAPAPTLNPNVEPTPVPQRISFAQGQFNTAVNGTLTQNGMAKWVLRILSGQTLSVNLIPTNGKARFSVVGADGTVLISDQADAIQWSGKAPASQDYTITVIAYDDTAPSYTLQITVPPLQPTVPPAPTPRRISFAPGGISATVQGTTPTVDVDRWVIAAMAGQTMSVNLIVPPGGRAALVIYGADGTVLISDHASAMQWSGLLPKTQDYFIEVKPETGAVSYTMQVTIPPR